MQIREENDNTSEDYILQKNKKTKVGVAIIVSILILIIIGIFISGLFFEF